MYNEFVQNPKETRQMNGSSKPVVLNTLMDQIFSMYRVHPINREKNAESQKVILRYNKPDHNVAIMSDPVRLKEIFVNMIDNALKFTKKGFVYYGFFIKDGHLTFYVMDSGIGTSKDRAKKNPGDLSDSVNGKLRYVSDERKGSNCYFTIPYHPTSKWTFADLQPRCHSLN